MRTTTTYDELVDVPTEVIVGLLHEHGERQLAEMRRQEERPSYRDLFLWRGVLDALAAAAAGERPDDPAVEAPRWLGGLVAARLDEAGRFSHRGGDFTTVRILERRGLVSPPHDDTYALALVGGLGGDPPTTPLRADPELLSTTIWRIFEVEGGGEVSLAAIDKYTSEDVSWATTVRVLIDSGDLDRDRVLDGCLAALDRDFGAFRAGWFSRLWVALTPSDDEAAVRQGALRSLLRSDVKPTVTLAVKELTRLATAGTLDADPTARALSAAVVSPVKGTAVAAVALLTRLHARGADVVPAASAALTHPHADVQRAAAILLQQAGAGDVVDEARDLLAPSVAVQVTTPVPRSAAGAQASLPVDAAEIPPLVALEGSDLTERLAGLLEDADDIPGIEMVLAGLASTGDPRPLEPLRARATKIARSAPREGTTTAWLRGQVARLILRSLGDDVAALPVSWDDETTTHTLPVRFLVGRLDEVADIAAGRRPARALLAAPEHATGWIDPGALVDRLLAAPDQVTTFDLVGALLRVHPEGRGEAVVRWAAGAGVPPDLDHVVRHALGAESAGRPRTSTRAWWVAAARSRSTTEIDPVLLEAGITGAGRAHPLDLRVTTAARSRTYQSFGNTSQTYVERSWSIEVVEPVARLVVDEPTGVRREKREWRTDALGELVGWIATIWPADAEHLLASLAGPVLDAAVGGEIEHDAGRVLAALGDHPGRLGHLAGVTLAAGLSAERPVDRVHAVDAVARLVGSGRLTWVQLAEGVTTLGVVATLTRLASSWADLASISPQASTFVVDTLTASLPHTDRTTTGMHAVLAVLEDELLRAGRPTPPDLQPWLREFAGTSKAARTAARLAAR
ncbi:DUF6493 family protein [Cellulomonas sp. Leaf334]|uniref:DUF6493 family protein n=1 Tax=Cellulomonas sp. Leaf334 TaxID=1736339 RepID=UPI000702267E|nr:DUF6493 family protein [Cellulomonas sp. Leaf334]KQR11742.1 hypothetical protein ASF78_10935 [Cellulomonas sp. Leaf334]